MAHGAALPLLMLFFGDLINAFVYEHISSGVQQLILAMHNASLDCFTTISVVDSITGNVTNVSIQSQIDIINPGAQCTLGDEFINQINIIVFIFLGIAAVVWIAAYLQVGLLQASAERQVQKIRLAYYRAVLRQNVAWYDENPSGEISSRLSE